MAVSALREVDSKKWINALVAVAAFILTNVVIRSLYQVAEWTDLEAKITDFRLWAQVAGIAIGVLAFGLTLRNKRAYQYLSEVYGELTKVIWSDKNSTLRLTVSIVIGVTISAVFLGIVDFGIKTVLELLY